MNIRQQTLTVNLVSVLLALLGFVLICMGFE